MGYDDSREIFERLEALERLAHSRSGERGRREDHRHGGRDRHDHGRDGHHDRGHRDHDDHHRHRDHDDHRERGRHDHGRGRGGDEFNEKRIIDTIVRLVSERVERTMQDQRARMRGLGEDGGEKRVVDLIVGMVGGHVREIVQEIVSTELDRRLGPPGDESSRRESSEPERR